MGSFFADLRHALRLLRKNPVFTAIAIAALALGIGANTAIFSVVNAVLLRPLPYPDADRLVRVERKYPRGKGGSISVPKYTVWKQHNKVLDLMCAYLFVGLPRNLGHGDTPEQVSTNQVTADYFRLFGAMPAIGRTFTEEEDRPGGPRVTVLSDGLWKRRFGADASIVGRAITLGGEPYTVVGVLSGGFRPEASADLWIPLQPDPNSTNQGHYLQVAARLKPGVTLEAANAQLELVGQEFRRLNPKWMDDKETVAAYPMQQEVVGNVRLPLLILTGAVSFVLLIACANVANLLLARAAARQKEIAIRCAVGAGRGRLVAQLLTESVLLASMGGALGLLLGSWGVRLLLLMSPGDIPRLENLQTASPFAMLDWRVLSFTVALAVLTGIIFGLIPALQLARTDVASSLKEGGRAGDSVRHNRARGLLVVSEMALALVLLIGAALLIRSFVGLRRVDPGFDSHNVLTLTVSMSNPRYSTGTQMENFERQTLQRLESLPGVLAATPTVCLPVQNYGIDLPFTIEGKPPSAGSLYNGSEFWRYVGPRYFDVFKIPLRRGRVFNDRDTHNSAPVVVINEAMARQYWKNEDPIGARIDIGRGLGPQFTDTPRQVVGIVGDVRERGLGQAPPPIMYIPAAQVPDGLTRFANGVIPLTWAIRTQVDPATLTTVVQREMMALDSSLPLSGFKTMERVVRDATARENFNMLLLSVFAAIALLLAAIGIYGVMSYAVEQRSHEIGVRMALGAGAGHVLRLFVGQGLRLAGIGVVLGLAAAFGLTRLLGKLLFGVKAADPLTFAGVAGLLTLVALLATYIPARRATRVDPIIALRYE